MPHQADYQSSKYLMNHQISNCVKKWSFAVPYEIKEEIYSH